MKLLLNSLLALLLVTQPTLGADADKPAAPPSQIVIIGARSRDPIPFAERMTVSQAISRAGGIAEFASASVFLIRNAKSTHIPLREILKNGKLEKDALLQAWDIIYIR